MSKKTLTDSISSINESIAYDEETNIFSLKEVGTWLDIATEIKNLNFNYLMCITSIDMENSQLALAYNLHSTETKDSIEFNLFFDKDTEIPSVESLWRTADWHEREAYDMMGIKFINHPDMKRILLPQDWEGYPLRKNYKVADYYHGMYIPKDKTSWE